jgi:hypothetical protein
MVASAAIDVETQGRRPPPRTIKVLLPVWGYSYIRQFLECGLPTLLSPGNIPAIAAELPTEFVVLTSADDQAFIEGHPTFARLAATCKTTIRPIDHLITDRNYSTTITLAYTEEVRAAGASMVDTCFFFLVSDYIIADGSLANALKRMQKGISAVVVGNFQAVREDALPLLQNLLTVKRHILALPPRVLMRWALNHLHPATLANTVNLQFNHNSHTNRLFWRVDSETILGRFYLMHMLCVRPEVTDFIIGASCDYSFVPEMCPSGNVEAITDSDEYLVVELQPRRHEAEFLRPGPLQPRALAKSLNDWTTSAHRENVGREIIFHAGELPPDLKETRAQSDKFLAQVSRYLRRKPRPYRGHPYWRGAMAAFCDATGRKLDEQDWRYALGLPATEGPVTRWLLYRARNALMGRPPQVLPWHPRWPDLQTVFGELVEFFADPALRLLTVSNEPTVFSLSLADSGERVYRMRGAPFLQGSPARFTALHGTFDLCLLELLETDLVDGDQYMERILPLMKNGGQIIVSIENRRAIEVSKFGANVAFKGARLIVSGVLPTTIQFIPLNVCRRVARQSMAYLRLLMKRAPWIGIPTAIVGTGFVLVLSLVGNLDTLRRRVSERGCKSSSVMRLTVSVAASVDRGYDQEPNSNKLFNAVAAAPTESLFSASTTGTREPQYNRCIDLRETIGLTSLGLMTNQVWYDDPRRLTFLLARYKFVAKMLEGRRSVGEIGCGDAFGTRVVLQAVSDVTVYDFDPLFIEDIRQRQDERWPLKAEVHNIVADPLPRKHDALYSLDVLEHIAPADEHAYLSNLCASLTDDGLLMIGTPSLESQAYASPPSKAGHINCKSGKELKALLEKYFTHVFLFSMNDEIVHTGFAPMAHYLFALCAKPTWQLSAAFFQEQEERPQHEVWPLFEICEQRDAGEFYVQVTYDGHMSQRVDGFKTVAEAAHWISKKTADYIAPESDSAF